MSQTSLDILFQQVKEMEQILRRRYPNSLPALMLAAATVPDAAQPSGDGRSRTVEALEKRVKKLEGELEKKDEESATLLRGMEQKYNAVKVGVASVGVCVCVGVSVAPFFACLCGGLMELKSCHAKTVTKT